MPLYEGIGLINEKHAVVIEIGKAYTKCGFAGENSPRCIVKTRVLSKRLKSDVNIWDFAESGDLRELLIDFIHYLYFNYLLVNPKDRRVVVVESVLTPTLFRETLAEVLFKHFEVSSICFCPSHLMALFTLGISNALVVDVGYEETHALPIFSGVVMVNQGEDMPLGFLSLKTALKTQLMKCKVRLLNYPETSVESAIDLHNSDLMLEDIIVRTCFVTPLKRVNEREEKQEEFKFAKDVDYPIEGDKIIKVTGVIRETLCDHLFRLDDDNKSIVTVILDAIYKSAIDMRRTLAENIVLIGGTTMLPGFKARLQEEMLNLTSTLYKDKIALKEFKFHAPPALPNYTTWLGGAIFGGTDALTNRSVSRDEYNKTLEGKLPDWCNFEMNVLVDDEKGV